MIEAVTGDPVQDAVPPATGTKIQAPHDSFVDEAHLLQSPLLGQVVGLSPGLEPVGGSHLEEVPDKLALSLGPNAQPSVLREEGNADLEVAVPSGRPPVDPVGRLSRSPKAGLWGPDDGRLSCQVLREPGGETPPGHSPGFAL